MTTAEATVTTTTVADIPVHLTPFVGRERELGDLIPLLAQSRLVTLTGAGGSGKTRLAIELATRVTPKTHLTWVDLAPVAGGTMVAEQVALALRAHDRSGTSLIEAIVATLRESPTLLVLDNCEHVVDEAATFVEQVMRACQSVRVLATSREALGVPGETAWLVPPLANEEATALFLDRARAANPGFRPVEGKSVETICKRLDGIPLAIELAAARARVLSAEQIAERLDDAFRLLTSGNRTAIPRQRTLRGTMDWSYDLLNTRERALLRRLSVFAGGFTLDAAEAVCVGEPLAPEDILDGVAALVDKSLIAMEPDDDEATYRLLETVRQYALEKLGVANEDDATRQAHAEYFVAFAEEAEPHLFGGAGDMDWIERVRSASGNLRAAALWCERQSERSALALRIYVAINWYSFATGQLGDARQRLTTALERAGNIDALLRGRALLALAHIVLWQGDHKAVGPYADQALELLTRGNPIDHASALSLKAASLLFNGDPVGAGPVAEEALALARLVAPHCIQPFALYWRGWAATSRGDHELARESLEEAIAIGRRIRHRPGIAHALALLGRLAVARGDHEEALHHFSEGLEIHHEIDDLWGLTIGFEGLVPVFMHMGQPRRSARLLGAADALRDRMSSRLSPAEVEQRAALIPQLEALLGDIDALIAEGRTMPLVDAVHMAARSEQFQTSTFRVPMSLLPPEPVKETVDCLRVDVLGPLEVHIGDRLVPAHAWGSARPRELLVMLMMHPDGCTKEQIGIAFWPEASTAQLRNNFHVTLHRLRKALGHSDWITLAQERYRVDPAVIASFDVTSFETEARAALQKAQSADETAIPSLEKAAALYRGDFMDGEAAGDWHLTHRDRLLRLYIETLMALGEAHTKQQRHAKAAEAYRRVLVRDELYEDAVRALMQSLERGGERSSALRLYERFAERLKRELRAKPSASTVALHRELSRGEAVAS